MRQFFDNSSSTVQLQTMLTFPLQDHGLTEIACSSRKAPGEDRVQW